jgi:mono/diheme cytochrome c family protein
MSPKAKYLLRTVGVCLLAASGSAYTQDATLRSSAPTQATGSAGKKVYVKWCSDCHSTRTGPGSMALQRKYHGDPPAILDQRSDLTPNYIRSAVRHGVSFMPSFRKTEISDGDLALLSAYLSPPPGPTGRGAERP